MVYDERSYLFWFSALSFALTQAAAKIDLAVEQGDCTGVTYGGKYSLFLFGSVDADAQ